MKNIMYSLLKEWCDKLVDLQIDDPNHEEFDGGIACPACGLIHGRCGDAMYPMVYMYEQTKDEKYLGCAKKVFDWTATNCLVGEGIIINDMALNSWIGITVFTAMQLADILMHHKDAPDDATYQKWYSAYIKQVEFVRSSDMFYAAQDGSGTKTNVNYIFGKLAAMAGAYKITGEEKYKEACEQTAELIKKNFFDDDYFIIGECKPANKRSARGSGAIDVGYNVEESLSAIAMYVHLTGDEEMAEIAVKSLRTHAKLMLPDGGWDNSWSVRNAKWSYWGSRTSDGCHVAYCGFADRDPMFSEIAYRNLMLLKKCTRDGLLYGGPMYRENGYRACVHHTFCHAKSLCYVLDNGLYNHTASLIPCETDKGLTEFKTAGLFVINKGNIRATVSCYDFETVPFGHAAGGTLSMLYEKAYGPVIAAGMTAYQMTEPSNMQAPRYGDGDSLTPRIMFDGDGGVYVSCNDLEAECRAEIGVAVRIDGSGKLTAINHAKADGYTCRYEFAENEVSLHFECKNKNAKLILPIIAAKGDEVVSDGKKAEIKNLTVISDVEFEDGSDKKLIFNLAPGFSAVPFEMSFKTGEINIRLSFR